MIKANIPGCCNAPAFVIDDKCVADIKWKNTNITGTFQPQTDYWTYTWTEEDVPTNKTWLGFYLMATWDGPTTGAQVYTTQTMILPNTKPYENCFGDGKVCPETLV